jgi:hypothetical protein
LAELQDCFAILHDRCTIERWRHSPGWLAEDSQANPPVALADSKLGNCSQV